MRGDSMFNLLILLLLVGVSAVVFVLFTGFSAPRSQPPPLAETDDVDVPALGLDEMVQLAEALLARYGISVESAVASGPSETTMIGTSDDPLIGGRYVVACHAVVPGQVVPSTRLLEFRDEVKASGATKGLFITDGFFTSDARFSLEDAPVSLINRREIDSLRQRAGLTESNGS